MAVRSTSPGTGVGEPGCRPWPGQHRRWPVVWADTESRSHTSWRRACRHQELAVRPWSSKVAPAPSRPHLKMWMRTVPSLQACYEYTPASARTGGLRAGRTQAGGLRAGSERDAAATYLPILIPGLLVNAARLITLTPKAGHEAHMSYMHSFTHGTDGQKQGQLPVNVHRLQ